MSQTVEVLGYVPLNRGAYNASERYYKDNIVQYHGSSYIAYPTGYDPTDPSTFEVYITGVAPVDENGDLNTGWSVFASGNNKFTTGEVVNEIGIDDVPLPESNNLVKSQGIYAECVEADEVVGDPVGDWVESEAQQYVDNRINEIKGGVSAGFNTLKKLEDVYKTLNGGEFVSVATYASLPATGSADTLYKVASWDGSANSGAGAVDASKYSEYAWDGTNYLLLSVRSQIDDPFDISEYNGVNYLDLSDALSGTNVPATVRHGGMQINFILQYFAVTASTSATQPSGVSIDYDLPGSGSHPASDFPSAFRATLGALTAGSTTVFYHAVSEGGTTTYYVWSINVQTSDNKYRQYLLLKQTWSTSPSDWQGIDDEVLVGSKSLIKGAGLVKSVFDLEGEAYYKMMFNSGIYASDTKTAFPFKSGNTYTITLQNDSGVESLAFYKTIGGTNTFLWNITKGTPVTLTPEQDYDGFAFWYNGSVTTPVLVDIKIEGSSVKDEISALANGKVDKEAGRSLIDEDVAEEFYYEENPRYIDVETDGDDRLLEAHENDGTKLFETDVKLNNSIITPSVIVKTEKSPEFIDVELDDEGRILGGRKENGTKVEYGGLETSSVSITEEEGRESLREELNVRANDGDILTLHPKEVVLPILKTFKAMPSWFLPYSENYKYINFNLLWFSDLHYVSRRLARISKFYNEYKDYIDDVLSSGDILNDCLNDTLDFWHNNGADSFLNIMGNHECSDPPVLSQKQCYDKYFKDYLSYTGITIQENKSYWYKDHSIENGYKIRIIGIDYYHWKEDATYSDGQSADTGQQQLWLRSLLLDAYNNGYSVICAIHPPVDRNNYNEEDTPFQSIYPFLTATYFGKTEILDEIQDFIDYGGKFITWLTGHTHDDRFGTIKSHPDQLMITVGTAGNFMYSPGSRWEFPSFMDRTEKTMNDDLFDIISVNTFANIITLYRIGCPYDDMGRHLDSIAFDYVNKKIL